MQTLKKIDTLELTALLEGKHYSRLQMDVYTQT